MKVGFLNYYHLSLDYQIIIKSRLEGGGGPSHIEQSSETPWRESCDVQVKFFNFKCWIRWEGSKTKDGKSFFPKMWGAFVPNELLPS